MQSPGFVLRVALVSFLLMACGPGACCRSAEVDRYEAAHQQSIARGSEGFEYTRPLAQAWPEILAVCAEHGYVLAHQAPVEGRTLESEPKPEGSGDSRVLLRINRVDTARWKITFDRQVRSVVAPPDDADAGAASTVKVDLEGPGPGTESSAMAWTLLQRLEPARASELEAAAKQKAERAGATGRGYDRGCSACVDLATPR